MLISDLFLLEMISEINAKDQQENNHLLRRIKARFYTQEIYKYENCYLTLFAPNNLSDELTYTKEAKIPDNDPELCLGEYKDKLPIYLAGFGVGGCVAINHAYFFELVGKKVDRVVSFGSHAFLDEKSADSCKKLNNLNDNIIRYVIKNDLVPLYENGAFHVGIEKLLEPSDKTGLYSVQSIANYVEGLKKIDR